MCIRDSACGAEIVIVTIDTSGDMRLEDFCYSLYNDWEISERGLALVMAISDEDYYCLLYTSTSPRLPTATSTTVFTGRNPDGCSANGRPAPMKST